MARNQNNLTQNLDWVAVLIYILCVLIGWFNIYAAVYSPEVPMSIFDLSHNAGKQIMWIGTTILLIICILVVDYKFYETFAFIIYGFIIFMLILVLFAGSEINGSRSWIKIGAFSLQPAEFAKLATSLALAKYLSDPAISLTRSWKDYLPIAAIICLPSLLILLSNETGSMLVFASFAIMLYREGLPGFIPAIGIVMAILLILTLLFVKWYIAIGIIIVAIIIWSLMSKSTRRSGGTMATIVVSALMIAVVFGVDFFINNILQKHQRSRILVLLDPDSDPRGAGWNVIQSKIAIGSGRLSGKGFLEGTQTKFDFVPEQSTDFIFCTVGEEHGFIGAALVVCLFIGLITRLITLAERQRTRFARVYGYCVAGIIFFHFMINIGMTIGLMPVIGIPLPFFSYGGSSLWSFSVLLFIFLKIDSQRPYTLSRT
ncbi:rod shape-determining protein RodA [Arundinibacter roseus]|uniref:Cell wall polymerase n=1 Tax=Arundinibacter roseus TaxID=2070510 RepID=A0A4R4KFB9_9BACT|nr:rod shape-determining protein RodA [Arundinibacter roseus]TDB65311.1 rod shape-determining protein RodA [Arundinibacter roseus]